MKRSKEKAIPDIDDAPLTAKELARLRPLREVFPDLSEWSRRRKRARKGEVHKMAVSIRLSPEVIAFYKDKGPGWQTRIDETLRAIVAATK
jgi:uncharacterized protein (DUF4415 family)